jgi:hypothetical protein
LASYASRLNQNTFPTRNKNVIRKAKVIHVADSRTTKTGSCFAILVATPPVRFCSPDQPTKQAVGPNSGARDVSLDMECHRRDWRHTLLLMALVNNATLVSHFRGFVQVDIFRTVHIYI